MMRKMGGGKKMKMWPGGRFGAALGLVGLALSLLICTSPVSAQEAGLAFNLDQYRAAETPEDGFAISRPNDLGHLRFSAHLHIDYAYNPLVWEMEQGDAETQDGAAVAHQVVGTIGGAIGLWSRLVIYLGLPINLYMASDDPANAADVFSGFAGNGSSVGDLFLGARVRIVGDNDDLFGLGFQVAMTFPTAEASDETQLYGGDASVTGHPELTLELRPSRLRITANIGVRLRRESNFLNSFNASHELTYGAGVTIIAADWLQFLGEVYGSASLVSTDFSGITDRESRPVEGILGVRFLPGAGISFGLAGGAGFNRGAGSPEARALFTLGYTRPPPPACIDDDADNICHTVDACPDEPEDVDGFEDEDGCPDPDNDQDGILDGVDGPDGSCMNDPEDQDGFEDEDGCPDPDNDQDGILDGVDGPNGSCMNDPEDRDGFEDEDGCPDPDNDQDTVLDVNDDCPMAPGPPANRGCPRAIRVEATQIRILQRIEFEFDRDVLMASAIPILDEVRAALAVNAQIRRIRIEGHTDSQGDDDYNMDLSNRRANTVMRWLVDHGIEASRLEAQGFGESRPIASNRTREGRQNNRRSEFHIVDPAPPTVPPTE